MASPAIVACPEGAWTKVATSVTAGKVHTLTLAGTGGAHIVYLQTYRATGVAAPTLVTEGVPIVGLTMEIKAAANADIYIWCMGAAGSVRVDV